MTHIVQSQQLHVKFRPGPHDPGVPSHTCIYFKIWGGDPQNWKHNPCPTFQKKYSTQTLTNHELQPPQKPEEWVLARECWQETGVGEECAQHSIYSDRPRLATHTLLPQKRHSRELSPGPKGPENTDKNGR